MTATAIDRLQQLINAVGTGESVSSCIVDQAYAQAQHEELAWHHPTGGRAKYLEGPLFEQADEIVRIISDHLITKDGSDLEKGMIEVAEKMSIFVEENAPKDEGVHELSESGHPMVHDNGVLVYDRAPKVPRISN